MFELDQFMGDNIEDLNRIMKETGEKIASLTKTILFEGIESDVLLEPLQYFASHKNDVIRPSLMRWACEAVGGTGEDVLDASVAMVLECYYLGLINDVVDNINMKRFVWTLPRRYGIYVSQLVSVLLSTKAYFTLNKIEGKVGRTKFERITRVFNDFILRMIEGEALNLQVKKRKIVTSQDVINVFELESSDVEACTTIGAILGDGDEKEVIALTQYGRILGTLFLLREDLMDALNFSARLGNKLSQGSYPLPVLWAINHSKKAQEFYSTLKERKNITPLIIKRSTQLLFTSGAINHIIKIMEQLAERAKNSLSQLEKNEAKKMLELFADIQPKIAFKAFTE